MKKYFLFLTFFAILLFMTVSVSAVIRTVTIDSGWTTESKSAAEGIHITTNNYTLYIQNFTKSSTSTATRGLLLSSNGTLINSTTTLTGNIFVFSSELVLEPSSSYVIAADSSGSSYTTGHKVGSFPINLVDASATAGANDCSIGISCGSQTGNIRMNVVSIGMSNSSLSSSPLSNATYENINVTNTGFFSYIGSSLIRVVKGWFTDLDVSGTTNLTGQTYLKNTSCSSGQVLTTDTNGLVSCTDIIDIKSGSVSVTEGTPVTVEFNTAFVNNPYCTVSVDLSGTGTATQGYAFLATTPNTTAFTVNWQNSGGLHTEDVMWVCTDAGNP